jgi:hypothetical protein
MQGRGLDSRAHDLETIAKHKTRKAWFGEVWARRRWRRRLPEGLLLLCARELVAPSRAPDWQERRRFEMEAQRRATRSEPGSLPSEAELLGAFPLCKLPRRNYS